MEILKKFTIKNLKLNKKRTIVTIIGVILSTALICAVAGMLTSTQKTLVNATIKSEGNYHVSFKDVPKDQIKYIKENNNVDFYFLSSNLGYAKLDNSKNEYKPYVYIMQYDKKGLNDGGFWITEGRMPENSNEIVISEHMLTNARVNFKIGETIKLNVGTRALSDGTNLTQINPYIESENKDEDSLESSKSVEDSTEQLINTTEREYKIVGIMKRPSYSLESYEAPGYTAITYSDNIENEKNINISVIYKNLKNNEETTKQIMETIKDNTGIEIKKIINKQLIGYQGGLKDDTMKVLYYIGGVVIAIIVISSVFVIRNSFSISVSEKTKQYGMLTSVGATKKQIKKTVLLEGFIIGAIAIPLGIACGILAIVILLAIVNSLLGDMIEGYEFVYSVTILPIFASIAVSVITIYLSCIIPAKKASKISPIEAIRGNEDIKIKPKKVKISKLVKKLFGIGGVIASKNLKRSKKKYRTTVISLVVSISIFVSLSSFLEYGKKITNMYYQDLQYNVTVYGGTEDLYKEIIKLENIENYEYSYNLSADIDIEKYGTEYGKKMNHDYDDGGTINMILMNNEYFKQFVKELGLNEKNYKDIVILEDDMIEYGNNNKKTIENYYTVKSGDTIQIKINDEERAIRITKKTDKRPMGFESCYSTGGYLFVSEDFIQDKASNDKIVIGTLNINSSDSTTLENKLIDLKREDSKYSKISITNLDVYAEQQERMILLISIFLYGFIGVITLIGVTNIFNTITTNMILRSKEFANLKSIGMTKKEFNKMIRLESILYGLKSLIIGIPIGLVGSYFIYKSFGNEIDFGYMLPWKAIFISVVFVFIIVGLTMRYSLNKINKQNIIETIRKDNI